MATITGSAGAKINAAVTVGNDGVLADEADQAVTAQSFANDLATAREALYPCVSVVRHFDPMPALDQQPAAQWDFAVTHEGVWTDGGHAHDSIDFPLDVPHGAILVSLSAVILPASGHVSVVPTAKPKLDLWIVDIAASYATSSQTQTDPTSTLVSYEAQHTITLSADGTGRNTAWSSGVPVNEGDFRKNDSVLWYCSHGGTTDAAGAPLSAGNKFQSDANGVAWVKTGHADTAFVVDRRTAHFYVRFIGEADSGANAVDGLILVGLKALYTIVAAGRAG